MNSPNDERPSERLSVADVATAQEWWRAKRRRYDLALCIAGVLGFTAWTMEMSSPMCVAHRESEITVVTTLVQGVLFLVAVGLANIFYSLREPVVAGAYVSEHRRSQMT